MQQMEADKAAVAAAYVAARSGEGSQAAVRRARIAFEERWGVSMPRRAAHHTGARGTSYASYNLDLDQYPQINNYFCGPASGKMILKRLNAGSSAYNGAAQDQEHIGGPDHMRTSINGKTGWASGLFRVGLNRWRQGTDTGFYVDKDSPTTSEFRNVLGYDIENGYPFGASTVEFTGGAHYNGHPDNGDNIGHWIVAHGYSDSGDKTKFADPATSVWSSVNPHFTHATNSFVNTYLSTNGITW